MGLVVVIGIVVVIGTAVAVAVVRERSTDGAHPARRGAREHRWRTSHWAAVARIADDLARTGFRDASGLVAAALVDRCREIARLARVVDRRGSAVDAMLHEDLVTELALLERAQRHGSGAVVLVRWPRTRADRIAIAAGMAGREWAELAAHDQDLAARLFRELPPRTTELPVVEPA